GPLRRAARELHEIAVRRAGDAATVFAAGELEREPRDLLAALHADQLQALRDAGRLHVLDAGVQVLDVLPHHDEVDAAARVGRRHAGQLAHRADVRVGL